MAPGTTKTLATAGSLQIVVNCSDTGAITFQVNSTAADANIQATLGSPPRAETVFATPETPGVIETLAAGRGNIDRIDFDGYDGRADTMDGQLFGSSFGTTGCVVLSAVTISGTASGVSPTKSSAHPSKSTVGLSNQRARRLPIESSVSSHTKH